MGVEADDSSSAVDDHSNTVGQGAQPATAEQPTHTVRAGERLVWWGGALAAVGALAALVALLPLVTDAVQPASWLWFVAIGGVGVGVGMALWGMVRAARARSRYLRAG